jgi:DNA-binding transcriptional LysR family regulator
MFDWNDLRYLLAMARHGSTIAAGKSLAVSQSTVQRRLAELEVRIGRPVVAREAQGYVLTPFGLSLVPLAEKVEAQVLALEAHVGDVSRGASGVLRVTCPEPVLHRLMPLIERFRTRHANLDVEMVVADRYVDLLKGEADVAFRSGDTDAHLTGRKIADSVWSVFASEAYVSRHGAPASPADLARHRLVSFEERMTGHRVVSWLAQVAPQAHIVSRSSSVLGLVQAVKSGAGVGPLPNVIGEEAGLVRVFGPVAELGRTWRLLTPHRLRRTARVSTFFDFVHRERAAVREIFA